MVDSSTSRRNFLSLIYHSDGFFLDLFTKRSSSVRMGRFMDSSLSRLVVPWFVRKNKINMEEYERRKFNSFNDFFTRKILPGKRPMDSTPSHLVSPCDGALSIYKIESGGKFIVKGIEYTFSSLVASTKLAEKYNGGYIFVFRLCVRDYHRYSFADGGIFYNGKNIDGKYHTVDPIALKKYPVYKENERVVSFLKSDNFGEIAIIEVGAMMVGKIVNYPIEDATRVERMQEKGYFLFGGSTVILAFEKNRILLDCDLVENSLKGLETKVCLGEKIAQAIL